MSAMTLIVGAYACCYQERKENEHRRRRDGKIDYRRRSIRNRELMCYQYEMLNE